MSLFAGIELPGHPSLENVRRLDLLPMKQIALMERKGIAIDIPWLQRLSSELEVRKTALRKDILNCIPPDVLDAFTEDGGELNINSPVQIGELLFKHLGVGRGRRLKLTKAGTVSTGKKQLETIKRDHPVIPLVLEYRECAKLKSTYTDALPKVARLHKSGGCCELCGRSHLETHPRIHTSILTTRTDTGRLASKNPNLQNIPARTKMGREVRKAFIAERGKRLIDYDYAQIELRLLASAAQEQNMVRIFRDGGDIHADTAARAFNIPLEAVDKMLHRAPCKNVNFGVCYGLQATGLYDLMAVTYAVEGRPLPDEMDVEWCEKFILKWFDLYPQAADYFDLQHYRAQRYGVTWCMFGGVRRIPEVRSVHEHIRMAGLRQAGNNPIQRGAAGVFKLGMARTQVLFDRLSEDGIQVDPLLPIHDELIAECDEEWADEVGVAQGWEMSEALRDEDTLEYLCRVPIEVDGKTMERWEKE